MIGITIGAIDGRMIGEQYQIRAVVYNFYLLENLQVYILSLIANAMAMR
jgi:hypothetical protein